MKGTFAVSVMFGLLSVGSAAAESTLDLPENPLETPWSSAPLRLKRWVSPDAPITISEPAVAHAAPGFSRVIYMNNCKAGGGCQIKAGFDNSLTNTSQIPSSNTVVQPFAYSDATWNAVVQCVRETYAPFAVQIVTERPTSGNYHMAIVAGVPQNVGEQQGVGGVSPFGCGYLANAISYSFANVYNGNVDAICWTVAQETAHSWGLDHKFDNRDPMTYLSSGPSRKSFQNQAGSCGEFSARSCDCQYDGGKLNSFSEILQVFGGSTPTPPLAKITAPANGATNLTTGFLVEADVSDETGIDMVEFRIDNQLITTKVKPPWTFQSPATLAQGTHTLEITAYDVAGTATKDSITASIGAPCDTDSMCPQGNVCVQGRCVLGGGSAGGLGTNCTGNQDCSSGQCAGDGAGAQYCVESCDPALDACPSGFDCLGEGVNGVCWPGVEEGICSVGSNGRRNTAPTFLLLGLAALWITTRRRRRR
jgi:hypothetical protein